MRSWIKVKIWKFNQKNLPSSIYLENTKRIKQFLCNFFVLYDSTSLLGGSKILSRHWLVDLNFSASKIVLVSLRKKSIRPSRRSFRTWISSDFGGFLDHGSSSRTVPALQRLLPAASSDLGEEMPGSRDEPAQVLPLRLNFFSWLFLKSHCFAWMAIQWSLARTPCTLSFLPATPLSWFQTLDMLFELTLRPSRTHNLASYVASGTPEIQGHSKVCCARLARSRAMLNNWRDLALIVCLKTTFYTLSAWLWKASWLELN